MARLDWDKLRRSRPLDGADVRVDADGTRLWDREPVPAAGVEALPKGSRRLRRGVIVRRRQERALDEGVTPQGAPAERDAALARVYPRPHRGEPVRCPRCGARVSPRKLLRHARRCPRPSLAER